MNNNNGDNGVDNNVVTRALRMEAEGYVAPQLPTLPTLELSRTNRGDQSGRSQQSRASSSMNSLFSIETNHPAPDPRLTPRNLRAKWTGQMLKPDALRSDLTASLTSYEDFAEAVRRDIKAITNSGIPVHNLRAAKYMKRWGLKKFRDIFAGMLASLMGAGFDRWRDIVVQEKKAARMEAYLKYQGGRRMGLFLRNFILKFVAGAWVKWLDLLAAARREEDEKKREAAARLLQQHYRGHEARNAMKALRAVLRKERDERAALKIQSW